MPASADRRRARRHLLLVTASTLLAPGCAPIGGPTRVPIPRLRVAGPCAGAAPALVVMLPGAYSTPEEFVDAGFIEELRRRGVAADVVIAAAHTGYYLEKTVLERLQADIVRPARAQGYRQVWLVGISLGGFGALMTGARPDAGIDGIVALAPYLGRRTLIREIVDAGGPRAWQGRLPLPPDADSELRLWHWLASPAPGGPPVWLGAGRHDRFNDTHRLLAQVLPADRVDWVDGGHDWPPWRALWSNWLDRGLLPRACSA